jgi:hypothetical protein
MGVEVAQLVLEYLKVLVWPAVAVWVALRYRRHLDRLIERITTETEEVEAKFLGLSAKFRKQITRNAQGTSKTGSTRLDERTSQTAVLAAEQVRLLADIFFSRPLTDRQAAAREVQQLAPLLRLEDVFALADSSLPGEHVAAGIALREHILKTPSLAEQNDVIEALKRGLSDPLSRVRYRFVRAAAATQGLLQAFRDSLERIAKEDNDAAVRQEAAKVLDAG